MADVDATAVVPPEPPLASIAVVETVTVEEPSELLEKPDEIPDVHHKEEVVTVEAPPPVASEEYNPPLVHIPPPQPLHEKLAHSSGSFKEESNKPSDLSDAQRVCLSDLRSQIQSDPALSSASIWGIPLFKDDRTDVLLLKFLRARDFKVNEALVMFRNTVDWMAQFGIDQLLEEDLGDDLEKAVFMHGFDKDGHPVCFNVYGEFRNKEVYDKTFGNEEKRTRFLRWRIQFLERSIRKLDFSPGGICTIFQVSDLKNSPGPGKKELRMATRLALQVLQDNYPEFVAKQVFINVPWWYLAYYAMISPFLTQRTRSKFVFASPARTPEVLFKYTSPEHVPVQYGGLSVDSCDCDSEFTADDQATEMTVKPGTKQIVEIIVYERCILVWELRVIGWEVRYGAEFVPNVEDGYSINIQKPKKMAPINEPVVHGSYKVSELGKVLLTVDNPTSKKKKLLYRFKVKPFPE